ncbi:kinesin-like protein KIF20B [Fopius arisanus]|uniref:Kinesin-like protein KIF20B n=1 Tax=Fopius arisanus TaxID=64838 RepID=A0A9R1TKQ3_9HYME|nr:PREDICTED: kinesin-like protein KIF20B [Fopius arisanus]
MSGFTANVSKGDRLLDPIRPSDGAGMRNEMSYLYGRDPSILAYSQRPGPSAQCKKNLSSDYETEESIYSDGTSLGPDVLSRQTVKVFLRLKPFPRKMKLPDEQKEAYEIINTTTLLTRIPCLDTTTVSMKKNCQIDTVCRKFTFTETFGPDTTQLSLFERVIRPQMEEFFDGRNCIAMTYGTTNSGKSHTLQGSTSCPGIIPRSLEYVFSNINPRTSPCYKPVDNNTVISLTASERLAEMETTTKILSSQYISAYKQMQKLLQEESPQRPSQATDAQYLVWVSFAEIYNEVIYDLLSSETQKRRIPLKLAADSQGRAFIKNLKTVCVHSGSEAYQVLMAGQCNLKVAATALNARSSRSHCIFTITLLKFYNENRPNSVELSRFSFCDLAGSERLKKTLNVGDRLKEAQNINTSLLVLGRCLKSIYEGQLMKQRQEHLGPFRESKLTRLFQQALSGKEPMALIVNVNPLPNLYEETQHVLNLAAIAKNIVIQPKKPKRRRSLTRFSLVVAQSTKTATDWDDTDLEIIAEQSSTEEYETQSNASVAQTDYDELIAENERLKGEYTALKTSHFKRDLQIREELANSYAEMLEKIQKDYKAKIEVYENQQEEFLECQLTMLKDYYEKKLACKESAPSEADDDDEEEDNGRIVELQRQVSMLSGKVISLKMTMKDLRTEKMEVEQEKNNLKHETTILKDELTSVKARLASLEEDFSVKGDGSIYILELKEQLTALWQKNKNLKDMLNEAKLDYIEITDDCREKEEKIARLEAKYIIESDKCRNLESAYEDVNALYRDETQLKEEIENHLEREINLRKKLEKQLEMLNGNIAVEVNSTTSFIKKEMLSPTMEDSTGDSGGQEVFLEFRDIPIGDNQMIESLNQQIQLLEEEKKLLSEKLSYSVEEINSLKEDLRSAKGRIDEIGVQLSQRELTDMRDQYDALKANCEEQVATIKKLSDEVTTANGILENYSSDGNDQKRLIEENKQLLLQLKETSSEKDNLSKQVENLQMAREDLESQIREWKKKLGLMELEINNLHMSDKLRTGENNKLTEELAACRLQHASQVSDLKDRLKTFEESNQGNSQAMKESLQKIQQLELKLENMENLERKISETDALLSKCQTEKSELEMELKKNEDRIFHLKSQLEQSEMAGKDKDDEIVRLQKELKTQIKAAHDPSTLETEKAHKQIIQELSETRAALGDATKINEALETKIRNLMETRSENYEQTQKLITTLQRNIAEQTAEIKDLKTTNVSIINSLDEKETEMEHFKKNRDETIARYEVLVRSLQDNLDREKREVMRYQEVFTRQGQTPREKDDDSSKFRAPSDDRATLKVPVTKPRDESTSDETSPKSTSSRRARRGKKVPAETSNSDEIDIPVYELSPSESKRTTRRTAAATAVAPTSEKRIRKRKKLFNAEPSAVDLTPEVVPPSPSPSFSRSLRSRRK